MGEKNFQDISKITQKVRQEYLKSKRDIFRYIHDLDKRSQLSEILSFEGTQIASLSLLDVPTIVYLMGLCGKRDFDAYKVFEYRFLEKMREEKYPNLKENRYDDVVAKINIEIPHYEEVIEYAKRFGYVISMSKYSLEKAKELKRTASLFEKLKTNLNGGKITIEDGLLVTDWYEPFSKEETEYNILNSLVLLSKSLAYPDLELIDGLNQLIFARWQKHLSDLKNIKNKNEDDLEQSIRIGFAIETLKNIFPLKIKKMSNKERSILLYQMLQKSKVILQDYFDEDSLKRVIDWIEKCTQNYEKSVSNSIRQAKEIKVIKNVGEEFFELKDDGVKETSSKNEISKSGEEIEAYQQKLNKTKKYLLASPDEKLILQEGLRYKKVFDSFDEYLKEKSSDFEYVSELIENAPKKQQPLVYIGNFSDIYSYYVFGIINKEQADDFYRIQKKYFEKSAIRILDENFDSYMEENDGVVNEEIEESYEIYKTGREKGCFKGLNFEAVLLELGVSDFDIEKLEPNVPETLQLLLKDDFDKYLPLALHFKKEYFNLIDYFKDVCVLLTAIDNDLYDKDYFGENLIEQCSCVNDESPDKTKINRLMVIKDIFSIMDEYIGGIEAKDFVRAKRLLKDMIYGTYHDILNRLECLSNCDKHVEVAPRLKEMVRYFSKIYPKTNVLKNEKENMAFLANVARSCLMTASVFQNMQYYYVSIFDKKFGTRADEDEKISKQPVKVFPVIKNIEEFLTCRDYPEFLKYWMEDVYSDDDLKINKNDTRCLFGVCKDPVLLYAMGVLTGIEFIKVMNVLENEDIRTDGKDGLFISQAQEWLKNQDPALHLMIKEEHLEVMKQIRQAGSLIDSSYLYDNANVQHIIDFNKTSFLTTEDFKQNPLKAEGVMLSSLLDLMKALPEYDIQSDKTFISILNSYWTESVQKLLDLSKKESNPIISKRMKDQIVLFKLTGDEKKETIANRLKYYPKLFQLMRCALQNSYYGGKEYILKTRKFFEKEIDAFVKMNEKNSQLQFRKGVSDRGERA